MRLALIADNTEIAQESARILAEKYSFVEKVRDADVIIILGGDGFMLHQMHNLYHLNVDLYGMNCGTIGFLLNEFSSDDLLEKVQKAKKAKIYPLIMKSENQQGEKQEKIAFNEVSLLREARQSVDITIKIDGKTRLKNLVGDGVLVASPAGSSAYNYSVRGPIIPLNANLLALTPVSPFRPRGWRGALIADDSKIEFMVNNGAKRAISAVADFFEFRDAKKVIVEKSKDLSVTLLFDGGNHLEDKLISEQFL